VLSVYFSETAHRRQGVLIVVAAASGAICVGAYILKARAILSVLNSGEVQDFEKVSVAEPSGTPGASSEEVSDGTRTRRPWPRKQHREKSAVTPDSSQESRSLLSTFTASLRIMKATYGTDPEHSVDVTAILQSRIADDHLDVHANNDLAGDPHPNAVKKALVEYEYGGYRVTKEYTEGDRIQIP
jgi:hypothetical protein